MPEPKVIGRRVTGEVGRQVLGDHSETSDYCGGKGAVSPAHCHPGNPEKREADQRQDKKFEDFLTFLVKHVQTRI